MIIYILSARKAANKDISNRIEKDKKCKHNNKLVYKCKKSVKFY